MKSFRIFCACVLASLLLALPAWALAAPQVIRAEGTYAMGDNDSPKIARDAARQEALRAAVEKAGVYVESYSKTKNMQLTEDEVRTISGAVLKVINEDAVPELAGGTLQYTVHLTAEVDPDAIDLQAMLANKAELEKLQAERDALKKQNEELLAAYEKAKGREKRELGTELETRYDLSKVFDRSMSAIQRGEFQTAVETLTPVISDRDVKGGPLAYAFYLRGRAYYGMHRATEALSDFNDAERITPGDAAYPVWRAKQYRGLIYYDWRRYDDAVRELEAAYDASGRQDAAIADDLAKARRAAELQRHPAPAKQPSGSTKGVDWTKVITDIIIHSIDKGSTSEEG
ncbi:hypothetical protein ACQQ91_05030 [Selenomonas bovis]|uniref:hypothetical protein n=1 Tax=Selenomonas bovis TaxID=416586 RepID=UPI003D09319B